MRRVCFVVAAAACLTLAAGAGRAAARPLGVVYHRAAPHVFARVPEATSTQPSSTPPLLSYHGGPVMHVNTTHLIAWSPPGYSFPADYVQTIEQYLQNVAHDSGTYQSVFATDRQYTDGTGVAAYQSTYGTPLLESNPMPPPDAQCPTSHCVTDAQLQTLLAGWTGSSSAPRDLSDLYFVLLPPGIDVCDAGACSTDTFCAYHGYFDAGNQQVVYAVEPYFAPDNAACSTGESPPGNGSPSDVAGPTINTMSHEHNEAVTDPLGDAWSDDSSGNENGDECAYDFGAAAGAPGQQYNQTIDNVHYYVQQEWSNADSACVQSYSRPSFSVSPRLPRAGAPASFDAGSSQDPAGDVKSYSWSFGDGTAGTGSTPSPHAYAPGGPYTATLTATYADGSSESATMPLTPSCQPSSGAVTSGADIAVVPNCSEPDESDIGTAAVVASPAHGTLSWVNQASGAVDYHANAGYVGPDAFSVELIDSGGLGSGPVSEAVSVLKAPNLQSPVFPTPPPPEPPVPPLAQLVHGLRIAKPAARRRGRITFTLVQAGTVRLALERIVGGVERAGACVRASRPARRAQRCLTLLPTHAKLRRSERAGTDTVALTALTRGRPLAPGAYRLVLSFRSAGGGTATASVRFRIG